MRTVALVVGLLLLFSIGSVYTQVELLDDVAVQRALDAGLDEDQFEDLFADCEATDSGEMMGDRSQQD